MAQILVVDDNPMIRKLLGMALSRHFSVCEAADAEAAMETIERKQPRIVFLDIMMPSADEGLELLAVLRKCPQTRDMVVAMVSSRSDDDARERAFAQGADAFFRKPFNLQEITDWAGEQLAQPQSR